MMPNKLQSPKEIKNREIQVTAIDILDLSV